MGATRKRIGVAAALFGKARLAVLTLLFGTPDEAFYLRQISAFAGVGQGAVQRELERLTQAGLVLKARRGQHVFYQANQECVVFAELSGLVQKTTPVGDLARAAEMHPHYRTRLAFVVRKPIDRKST
jgi:DNA-binding transcriptional ArsR family regulator